MSDTRSRRRGQHGAVLGSKRSVASIQRVLLERALAGDVEAAELILKLTGRLVSPEASGAGAQG